MRCFFVMIFFSCGLLSNVGAGGRCGARATGDDCNVVCTAVAPAGGRVSCTGDKCSAICKAFDENGKLIAEDKKMCTTGGCAGGGNGGSSGGNGGGSSGCIDSLGCWPWLY